MLTVGVVVVMMLYFEGFVCAIVDGHDGHVCVAFLVI
jgi:hypothetical protein